MTDVLAMRTCRKCHIEKNEALFSKRPDRPGGIANLCRACDAELHRERYQRNADAERERARQKGMAHSQRERRRLYDKRNWGEREPRIVARVQLRQAVKVGKVAKPDCCSECGKLGVIHGHHTDYDKPLDVVWLCAMCHGQRHRKSA